ncbi:MAG: hypothetical protein QOJ06_3241 [Pseudonocardiales bacterium]|nr:hypothetical protein [Pseudonocardiales bacterium]
MSVSRCSVSNDLGTLFSHATITIMNSTDRTQSYMATVSVNNANPARVSEINVFSDELGEHQAVTGLSGSAHVQIDRISREVVAVCGWPPVQVSTFSWTVRDRRSRDGRSRRDSPPLKPAASQDRQSFGDSGRALLHRRSSRAGRLG